VRDSDQINLTDEESRIMPTFGGKNFQQAYNVQAGVDTETMLVVTEHVTQHTNDKSEIDPTLKMLEQLPEVLGKVEAMLSDSGYRSENNVKGCDAAGITPYFPAKRQRHHPPVEERFTQPPAVAPDADIVEAMDHRLATIEGRAVYALRKSTVGTRVRNHQIGARLPSVSPARIGGGLRGMDSGHDGLESQTSLQSELCDPENCSCRMRENTGYATQTLDKERFACDFRGPNF